MSPVISWYRWTGVKLAVNCQFVVNPLQPSVAFLYPPENIRKPKGFLMFSGAIEKQHQVVMDQAFNPGIQYFLMKVW